MNPGTGRIRPDRRENRTKEELGDAHERVRTELRKETKNPSEKWVRVRVYGEEFNEALRKHVAESLARAGHLAVAPAVAPQYSAIVGRRCIVKPEHAK